MGLLPSGGPGNRVHCPFHLTKSDDDPNGIKLGTAKRGGYCKFRCLQCNNFAISTLVQA